MATIQSKTTKGYKYWYIVESRRVNGKPRPIVLAYLGKGAISPNKVKIAGSSDSSGVAIHAPYMHAGMANFARSIPDNLCRPDEESKSRVTGKYILMKMAEKKGLLPYDCIYQKKLAAGDAPIDDW